GPEGRAPGPAHREPFAREELGGLLAGWAAAGHRRLRWDRAAVERRVRRGTAARGWAGRSTPRRGVLARREDAGRDRARRRHSARGPGPPLRSRAGCVMGIGDGG